MGKKLKAVLKGMGQVIDLNPAGRPTVTVSDRYQRLCRPWERTGRAIHGAVEKLACEQRTK
jgi:hypothetical protein